MVSNIWRKRKNTYGSYLHVCFWFCQPSHTCTLLMKCGICETFPIHQYARPWIDVSIEMSTSRHHIIYHALAVLLVPIGSYQLKVETEGCVETKHGLLLKFYHIFIHLPVCMYISNYWGNEKIQISINKTIFLNGQ